jgi:archaellin
MSEYDQTVERNQEEGSIGIGAMIVFIALILVAAVASTIIIKTAEELQQNAESTSDDTRKEISGKISIISMIVNGTDGTDLDSVIVTAKVASGSTDVLVSNIDFLVTCGDTSSFGIVSGNLGTDSPWGQPIAGTTGSNVATGDGTWSQPNAETTAGAAYEATDELVAGTVFKFDINFEKDYLGFGNGEKDANNDDTAGVAGDGDDDPTTEGGVAISWPTTAMDAADYNIGPCATLAGVGETLQLKMIVDGGGTTLSELVVDSVVSGKAVV